MNVQNKNSIIKQTPPAHIAETKHRERKWYTPILNFATHTAIGTVIFVIVLSAALVLDWLMRLAEEHHFSAFVVTTLELLSRGILLVDSVAVLVYLLVTTYREIKEMLR
jgi:uncharacterized membrane protein YidH (DUF202 family)